jgi:fatty aldehyde-generating acyl-ACP reductase
MDSTTSSLDFAVIGHQANWQHITSIINSIRTGQQNKLSTESIRNIYSYIPPRDIFRIKVKSKTGSEVNGVYIETFIDPDKLGPQFIRSNISKVTDAISFAKKMGAPIVTLGGFTSIVLEGELYPFSNAATTFTTGNTLTAAYIVRGMERAATHHQIDPVTSNILIVGATGDIGMACVNYFKNKSQKLFLCGRNSQRLTLLAAQLKEQNIPIRYSTCMQELVSDADLIICAASSTEINLGVCKKNVLICDAGFPNNLVADPVKSNSGYLFQAGMGQISCGYSFHPDYSKSFYQHPAPNISHGCVLEAIVLALERKFESYSHGKGKITTEKMEEIYGLGLKHGITLAPFYNGQGLWNDQCQE